jgi:hypothetical protein
MVPDSVTGWSGADCLAGLRAGLRPGRWLAVLLAPCVLGREVALLALPPCSTRRYPAPLNAFPTCLPPRKGALVPVVDPKKKEGYAELIGLTYPEAAAATGI